MRAPPPDDIRNALIYDPLTGVFRYAFAPSNRIKVGQVAGTVNGRGYVAIKFRNEMYLGHRLAWFFVHGEWPELIVDHINRDKTDNRIENLRLATKSDNGGNMLRGPNKGIRRREYARSVKWTAAIKKLGREEYLGTFDTEEAARAAYAAAAERLFGKFARAS